jgi:aryl-alcohol dehydrogenase-like predicted oxidoreductase
MAEDSRVDVLMHRYNMAHRKASEEVFPSAIRSGTPVVAFTATRWGTLLKPHADWSGKTPIAADCYRYCLAQAAVHIVLSAPRSLAELDANLQVLHLPPMTDRQCAEWNRFGDFVHGEGSHAFETRWP